MPLRPRLPARIRKLIGVFLLIALLSVYVTGAVAIAVRYINDLGVLVQLPYYLIAGIAWAVPARWIVNWMQKPDHA